MLDISNNLLPPNIVTLFISRVSIHSHNTRSSSRGDNFVKLSRPDKQIKSFSRNSVKKAWTGNGIPDLCDAHAVLYQLSNQATCVQVVMWVHFKLVGVEIEDGNTGIFHAFEMQIGMNYLIFLIF